MKIPTLECEVVDVRTESGVCIGMARTKLGEKYLIDTRTPEGAGMCSNAFCSLANGAFIMMATDEMKGEKEGAIERVCPHGVVTFRLSRTERLKEQPFREKV
ncbi:MAG: hypothetical protein PQJ59_03415 [Spirochaetales bacterium]|nr:hypothetical protein [Spirochaetales bacterium]